MDAPRPLRLADGRLAALSWGDADAPTWVALHGWLDNAASFTRLAPLLVARLGIRIVAIDLAGHGHSASREGGYPLWDYCHDLLDACDSLALSRATWLAHSMGAGVACLTATAFPERVERLVLIDGLGTTTTEASDVPAQLRRGLRAHRRAPSVSPRYPDIETAVRARVTKAVTPIDAETAMPLVQRNLERLADGQYRLRTDGRLLRASPVRLCSEQALAVLVSIHCPVLLVEGESGLLGQRDIAERARRAVPDLERRMLPGGHHLHLAATSVVAVAEAIAEWLGE